MHTSHDPGYGPKQRNTYAPAQANGGPLYPSSKKGKFGKT